MLFQLSAEKMGFALKNITITGHTAQPHEFLVRNISIPFGRSDGACGDYPTKTTGANWERSLTRHFVSNFGCIDFQGRRFDGGVTHCQLDYPQNSFSGSFPAVFKGNIPRSSTYCGISAVWHEYRHSDFFAIQQQPCSLTAHDGISGNLRCSSLPSNDYQRRKTKNAKPPLWICVPVHRLNLLRHPHTLPNSSTNPATGPSPSTALPPSSTSASRPGRYTSTVFREGSISQATSAPFAIHIRILACNSASRSLSDRTSMTNSGQSAQSSSDQPLSTRSTAPS